MAFNFHSQAPKRKRETGFLSDDNYDDDDDDDGNSTGDNRPAKNNCQSLFADISTPPSRNKKVLNKSNKNGPQTNKRFTNKRKGRQYVSDSSTSLIHHPQGGSMQTLKKSQSLGNQKCPLKKSNNILKTTEKIKVVEKIKDEKLPRLLGKDKHNNNKNNNNNIQSQSKTSGNRKVRSETSKKNDNDVIQSPIHTTKQSIQTISSQNLTRRSRENNQMKTKLSIKKHNGSKSKQATKIIPGNSLKFPTNNNSLPQKLDKVSNAHFDVTRVSLNNRRKPQRLGKVLREFLYFFLLASYTSFLNREVIFICYFFK